MAEPFAPCPEEAEGRREGPLAGARVLDLSRLLPGPHLTRILFELGADVVKVESPEGDAVRAVPPFVGEQSAAFVALNAGKRGLALDLKRAEGVKVLLALAAKADVLVESFRPGVLDRLGLGWEQLSAANPSLIVCSITGYGQTGPLRDAPGHDLGYLARAGVLSLCGPAGAAPSAPGVQIADLGGGSLSAAVAVLSALIERGRTGLGRHLDISLSRGTMSFLAVEVARRSAGAVESRGEGMLTGGLPCYRVYRTKDDRFMALAALEPKFFKAFCACAGCPELAVDGLATGERGRSVGHALEVVFAGRTQAEWVQLLAGSESCCEPVQSPEEALADPAIGAHCCRVAGLPVVASELGVGRDALRRDLAAPSVGQHSLEIVREYGVDEALIAQALANGSLIADRGTGN